MKYVVFAKVAKLKGSCCPGKQFDVSLCLCRAYVLAGFRSDTIVVVCFPIPYDSWARPCEILLPHVLLATSLMAGLGSLCACEILHGQVVVTLLFRVLAKFRCERHFTLKAWINEHRTTPFVHATGGE